MTEGDAASVADRAALKEHQACIRSEHGAAFG
jgi:hypothetical protein